MDPDVLLYNIRLSHEISLCASFCTQGFEYSRGTLSVIVHLEMGARVATTRSGGGRKAECQDLNNGANVLFPYGNHFLQAMQHRHVDRDLR